MITLMLEKMCENIVDRQKTDRWITKPINLDFSFKTQIARLKMSYLNHIMQRDSSLEKVLILGKRRLHGL